jgi:hypothetical protein
MGVVLLRYQSLRLVDKFHNELIIYCNRLLAGRPAPELGDHPLSFVSGCLLNILTANIGYDVMDLVPYSLAIPEMNLLIALFCFVLKPVTCNTTQHLFPEKMRIIHHCQRRENSESVRIDKTRISLKNL